MNKKKIEIERRSVAIKELVIADTQKDQTEPPTIEGYAAVFDSWSEELGGLLPFREKVIKGAFSESIANDDIRALFNHNADHILGRNKAGTLELIEDEKGLLVKIHPPNTTAGKDLVESIRRGDVSQMSFGFSVLDDKWNYENEIDVRELRKVKLYDVSPVTYPAYTATQVGIRTTADVYEKRQLDIQSQEKMQQVKAEKANKLKLKSLELNQKKEKTQKSK